MDNKNGVIYILTNPSFPDYVKIGYADDIDKRLKQLNRSECIPYAFRIYATYEVSSRLSDLKIHSIIDKLNPNLRAVESFNGKQRVREFYAMSPEDAYSILEAIAEIHGCVDKLKRMVPSEEEQVAEREAQEIDSESTERATNFSFSACQIPLGAKIEFGENPNITACIFRPSESKETVGVSPPSREKQVQVHGRESTGVLFGKKWQRNASQSAPPRVIYSDWNPFLLRMESSPSMRIL